MDIMPEAVILFGAVAVGWVLDAAKRSINLAPLTVVGSAFALGFVIAGLLYAAGVVDLEGASSTQIVARAALAGMSMAMAASGADAQVGTALKARKGKLTED